jgi:hypothetical protein
MRGINKRREPLDHIYPVPELNKRKNYSKKPVRKPTRKVAEINSPRKMKNEDPNKQHPYQQKFTHKREELNKSTIEKRKDKFDG